MEEVTHMKITIDNSIFILLSFEGPDSYALAGGLGIRVTHLSRTLGSVGFPIHLFFVGDPKARGEETNHRSRLMLHRWCQWISKYYPNGVYEGENEKLYDFSRSLPSFTMDHIIKPALEQGKLVVILGEEWHTAEAMCRISDLLEEDGSRDKAVMFWNANNTFGFDRIDWPRLAHAGTITTVSRYMKQIMRERSGLDPLVIPNGIPSSLLKKVDSQLSSRFRKMMGNASVLAKIARWDPDKCWNGAVEATARLKKRGKRTVLIARGGIEPYGEEVLYRARSLGLKVSEVNGKRDNLEGYLQALEAVEDADILNLKFHCPQEFLRIIYNASDGVLANSRHEPFGLVGLETMAAGGVAFTGSTGEDYAVPFHNSVVLETTNPREIEEQVIYLRKHPEEEERIREAGRQTALRFTWEEVTRILIRKLEQQARSQGLLDTGDAGAVAEPPRSESKPAGVTN